MTGNLAASSSMNQDSVRNSHGKERIYWAGLAFWMILLSSVYPLLAKSSYRGSGDLHATMELAGALLALIAGGAIVTRFYALGDRFHLFIGLAFLVNGSEDFIHGLLAFEEAYEWIKIPAADIGRFIPGTYVTGRLMMGMILLLAPFQNSLFGESRDPKRETQWSLFIVLSLSIAATILASRIPLPQFIFPQWAISRPVDFLSALVLFLALIVFLWEYHRVGDMLIWWVLLSLGVNVVGQILMSFSKELHDLFFVTAHVYKVLGYAIPLLGFSLYQIVIITERKQVEEVLRTSEARYRMLVETPSDFVVMHLATDGRYLYVSPQIETLTGYRPEDFYANSDLGKRITHPDDFTASEKVFLQITSGGPKQEFEFRWKHRNRTYRWALEVISPIYDSSGRVSTVQVIAKDITEKKQMEEELIHTQRLRAVSELAAGVSHNLNNMLTGVLGPAQLLERYSDDPRVLRDAEAIIAGARRARDLVQRLNLAARGADETERVPVPVNQIIRDAIQAARPRWKDEAEARGIAIEVATNLGDVPTIRGTGTGLHDILLNLLFNAVDAMPEGGTITIDTQSVDDGVRLTVRDTGIGMEEETKRRVFEPFFTTKMDVGSGLGLATVHSMVESWGGHIEVESAPGQGTTFTLWLRVWDGPETPSQDTEVVEGSSMRRCRLLVIDDDGNVCRLLESLLSDRHEVEIVSDGQEGLERFSPGRFDVVLIDLGLPGMSGDGVAREMKRVDPAVVSVLITGWEMRPDDERLRVFDFQIPKPFDDLDEVEEVVVQAIELHDVRAGRQA